MKSVICLVFCLIAVGCSKHDPGTFGKVVSVYDGDTITVLTARNEQVKIRFYGIDAPERGQAHGTAAKQALSDMVFGKEVRVDIASTKDRRRDVVGKVYVGDLYVNEEMVRRGFAWWYVQYGKDSPEFGAIEKEAKAAKKGLWSEGKSIPPWQYRQEEEERRVLKRIEERKKKKETWNKKEKVAYPTAAGSR